MSADRYFAIAFLCFGIAIVLLLIVLPFMTLHSEMTAKSLAYCAEHDTPECRTFLQEQDAKYGKGQ